MTDHTDQRTTEAALDDLPPDKQRMARLYAFLIHVNGHGNCAGYAIAVVDDVPTITCLACGRTSVERHDIDEKYCGHCHGFHDDAEPPHWTMEPTT